MAPEKRNNFLDADESDDAAESQGYDSDNEVKKGGRSAKCRKLDDSASDSDASDDESDLNLDAESKKPSTTNIPATSTAPDDRDQGGEEQEDHEASSTATKPKPLKPPKLKTPSSHTLTKKNLVISDAQIKKSGVLYISRVPPFMKPHKLRSLLEPFGTINRTYLSPEDPTSHARRVKAGGNKKRLFTEGWVEFVDKRNAKRAHELLNARTIGGKKGTYYRDDVWSMVYLKGFKWVDLMAQMERESEERAARMRAEIKKAKRENAEFARNVERGKELDGIKAKREKKKQAEERGQAKGDGPRGDKADGKTFKFKQNKMVVKRDQNVALPDTVGRALGKIL